MDFQVNLDRPIATPHQVGLKKFIEKQEEYLPILKDKLTEQPQTKSTIQALKDRMPGADTVGQVVGERLGGTYSQAIVNNTIEGAFRWIHTDLPIEETGNAISNFFKGASNVARQNANAAIREGVKLTVTPIVAPAIAAICGPLGSVTLPAVIYLTGVLVERIRGKPNVNLENLRDINDLVHVDEKGVIRDAAGDAILEKDLKDLRQAFLTYEISHRVLMAKRSEVKGIVADYAPFLRVEIGDHNEEDMCFRFIDGSEMQDQDLILIEKGIKELESEGNFAVENHKKVNELIKTLAEHSLTILPELAPSREKLIKKSEKPLEGEVVERNSLVLVLVPSKIVEISSNPIERPDDISRVQEIFEKVEDDGVASITVEEESTNWWDPLGVTKLFSAP